MEQWTRRQARRHVRLVRFADDYLLLCEDPGDAGRLLDDLRDRLGKFGLALHEGKTRLVEFGRFAAANRVRRGEGRPETFDFLGFTHFCGTTRKGGFMVKRKTQRTRMVRKLKELRLEMKKCRHASIAEQSRWLGAVLRGHYAYFGITGNSDSIAKFHLGCGPMVAMGAAPTWPTAETSLGTVQRDPRASPASTTTSRAQLALLGGLIRLPDGRAQCGKAARWDL